MKAGAVHFLLTVSLLTMIATATAGCARNQVGQYAEAKQSWTEPRPAEVEEALRNRLVTTQRDN